MNDSLGETDEVLMVGVHVSQLAVDVHHDLLLALLLLLPEKVNRKKAFCFCVSQGEQSPKSVPR